MLLARFSLKLHNHGGREVAREERERGPARDLYELRDLGSGTYVFEYRGGPDDPHWLCAACRARGTDSVLHFLRSTADNVDVWKCRICPAERRVNLTYAPKGAKPGRFGEHRERLEDVVRDLSRIIVVLAAVFVAKAKADGNQSIDRLRQLLTSMMTEHEYLDQQGNERVLTFVGNLTAAADDEEALNRIVKGALKYQDPSS